VYNCVYAHRNPHGRGRPSLDEAHREYREIHLSKLHKRLISAFLIFHLLGVLTAPNRSSFLTGSLAPVYQPYLNLLGLASTWAFFAPEPFYAPIHIDYKIERKNGMPVTARFPEADNPYFFRDRFNRRISLARFVLATEGNLKGMFVHYLCAQYPDLQSVQLWSVMATVNSLQQVQKEGRKITDPAELQTQVLGTHYCEEK